MGSLNEDTLELAAVDYFRALDYDYARCFVWGMGCRVKLIA